MDPESVRSKIPGMIDASQTAAGPAHPSSRSSPSKPCCGRGGVGDWLVPLVGVCVVARLHRTNYAALHDAALREHQFRITTWVVALLVWPWVWCRVATQCHPSAVVGLLWPYGVMAVDVWSGGGDRHGGVEADAMVIEPQHVLSMCFACSGIVSAASNRRHMSLFMWPIVALLVTATAEPRGGLRRYYHVVRTVVTALCGGLLITGLLFRTHI